MREIPEEAIRGLHVVGDSWQWFGQCAQVQHVEKRQDQAPADGKRADLDQANEVCDINVGHCGGLDV